MSDKELFPKELWQTLEGEEGEKVRKSINGAMRRKAAMMGIKVDKTKALEDILAEIGEDVEEEVDNEEEPNEEGRILCLHSLRVPTTDNEEQMSMMISKIKTRIWVAITMLNSISTMEMMGMMGTTGEEEVMITRNPLIRIPCFIFYRILWHLALCLRVLYQVLFGHITSIIHLPKSQQIKVDNFISS
jgi:hypothetical protein